MSEKPNLMRNSAFLYDLDDRDIVKADVEEYGYYDKRPIEDGPELILVCRKKE